MSGQGRDATAQRSQVAVACGVTTALQKGLAILVTVGGERCNPVLTQTYVGGASILGGHRSSSRQVMAGCGTLHREG
jgi:hypothetical protein